MSLHKPPCGCPSPFPPPSLHESNCRTTTLPAAAQDFCEVRTEECTDGRTLCFGCQRRGRVMSVRDVEAANEAQFLAEQEEYHQRLGAW